MVCAAAMHIEHHHWYSGRLGRELGIVVAGHYGPPIVTFPTSGGNVWDYHDRLIGGVADFIDQGIEAGSIDAQARQRFARSISVPARR